MYLVDSSVWIETFRKRDPLRIESVVELEEIVTCLPVIQEVLQGFRDEAAYRIAREAMFSFQIVELPLKEEVFSNAVDLFRSARRAGIMGEVYRAKDTRLDRTVAIKVLPLHLSNNPDLKQRFEREARAISGLSIQTFVPL